jgi:hypothetical protein
MHRLVAAVIPFCALVLASCGGDSIGTSLSLPAIRSSTGATTFTLSAASSTTLLTVTEAGYHGTYTASSSNTAIATVSPGTLQSSSKTRSAAAKLEAVANGSGTFTVSATGNGNATIVINDDQQHSSSFEVVVTGLPTAVPSPAPIASSTATPSPSPNPTTTASPGPLSVSPTELTFNGVAQVQTVNVTDSGTTAITMSGCAGIATLAAFANGSFAVTSVAAGSCTITVSDAFTHQATIAVGVTTLGVPIQ